MPGLVLIAVVVLALVVLSAIGYLMGPAPGARSITKRDRRLQHERADLAAYRRQSNPNLRTSREEVVRSLSEAAVREARSLRESDGLLSETEALANAMAHMDRLERNATGAAVAGPLVIDVALFLSTVGVLSDTDRLESELGSFTWRDLAGNPGILVRLVGVRNLGAWP